MEKVKVGVVGHNGMVGSRVYKWCKELGGGDTCEVKGISLGVADCTWEELAGWAEVVFIAVPTPFDWEKNETDLSIINDVFSKLGDGQTVVIKSTVPIRTTENLQKQYPKLKIMFNPEFLSEKTAWEDFINPDRQFLGYTKESYSECHKVMDLLPESPCDYIVPSKEAELLKYINNLHGMMEIMESNHYYEVCQKEGLDYDRVVKCMTASRWVGCPMGRHYRVIYHNGKRGFGGICFPKDLNNYIQYAKEVGIDTSLFEAVRDMNKRILSEQGLSEAVAEKITFQKPFKKEQ